MDIDKSKNLFTDFEHEYESLKNIDNISESDTRSKVIDKLFIGILGWSEKDIQREGHVDSGYFDYKFSLPGFNLIIEAKKQVTDFILPSNIKKISINTLFSENKNVITQIRNYLSDAGIDYGIITNGKQFIIGKFVNHNGESWKNNQCLIFNGLEDIKNRYIEFYENISKESIIQNGGIKIFTSPENKPSKKIIATLIDREKEIIRNNISVKIAPLLEQVFGEIYSDTNEDNLEFIKECFVENKEIIKNKAELNGLFEDLPPELSEVSAARNIESISKQIDYEVQSTPISAKETIAPKPIIIVGSKGAGKTTFINFLFKNKLSSETISSHPYVYVDFIKYYKEDKNIDTEKIAEDIIENLYDKYEYLKLHTLNVIKRVYIKEIHRNDEGIWKSYKDNDPKIYNEKLNCFLEEKTKLKLNHLEQLSKYLIRERRIRIIIIIDNADQFDNIVQEKVFLFANSLNRKANCGIFISLREGYYYKWRNRPPFNAFESNVYHLTAPLYSEVLQKRISYTLKYIDFTDSIVGYNKKGVKYEIDTQNIKEFFSGLNDSLFDQSNSLILDFLNYSTFPNIREGLRLFKLFLISGYTDVEEYILRVRFNKGNYSITIPIHEFVKAIGLSNKLYYNHEISIIPNLFYPCNDSNDHFLKIWILKYLLGIFSEGGNIDKFEQYSQLVSAFSEFGYRTSIINKELSELLRLEFIESDKILTDIKWEELPYKEFNISISTKGYYYIKDLMNHFYYLELILQDTPIYDDTWFGLIKSTFPSSDSNGKRPMRARIDVVNQFVEYLADQESKQPIFLLNKYGSIIKQIKDYGLNSDILRIEESIKV